MIKKIAEDYNYLSTRINEVGLKLQKEFSFEITAGKLYSIAEMYEKNLWMLKSLNTKKLITNKKNKEK